MASNLETDLGEVRGLLLTTGTETKLQLPILFTSPFFRCLHIHTVCLFILDFISALGSRRSCSHAKRHAGTKAQSVMDQVECLGLEESRTSTGNSNSYCCYHKIFKLLPYLESFVYQAQYCPSWGALLCNTHYLIRGTAACRPCCTRCYSVK